MRVTVRDVVAVRQFAGVVGIALVAGGCASAGPAYEPGTFGALAGQAAGQAGTTSASQPLVRDLNISIAEGELRRFLAAGDTAQALRALGGLPKDELLRQLHLGLVHHRAGRFDASNKALQAAEAMAEDRYTKSLRQVLGASVINETVADYVPPAHERAFIHYYGMLNYMRLGNVQSAAIEARRANQFLERYARENGARTFTTDAAVEYLAGILHLMNGDQNDALVSYRKSLGAFDTYSKRYGVAPPRLVGVDAARVATRMSLTDVAKDVSDKFELSAAEMRPTAGAGELLVLVENGFIAHRAQAKLTVSLLGSEVAALETGGLDAWLLVGIPVVDRIITLFQESSNGNEYAKEVDDAYMIGAMVTGGEVISAAWPRYHLQANAVDEVTVSVGTQRQAALVMDDLSAIAARSFEEEKARFMRRAMYRAAGKWAIVKAAEKKAEAKAGGSESLKGIFAGAGAKLLGQGLANKTEVADTRSWSTLPAEIRASRFSLPPGEHQLKLTVRDADGSTRDVDLGRVMIQAGKVAVHSAFVTGGSRGSLARFEMARGGADVAAVGAVATGVPIPLAPVPVPAAAVAPARGSATSLPATLATVTAVRAVGASFRPLSGETMKFAVTMRAGPTTEQRGRAELSAFVVKQGSTDTSLVWNGGEGDTLTWGGMLGNAMASAGAYTWILRATTPRGDRPTQYTWVTNIDLETPNGASLAPDPAPPKFEPVTKMMREPNWAKKGKLKKHGVIWGVVGSALTTAGYSMAVTSIASTPPDSPERATARAVWGVGAITISFAGLMFTSGLLKSYAHDVPYPDPGAKVRNDDAKAAHDRAVAGVRARNERVKTTLVMRVRTTAAGERRP